MKMKLYKPERNREEIVEFINKILLIVIGVIAGIILLGTIIGFFVKGGKPGKNLRTPDPEPTEIENLNKQRNEQNAAFTEIKTMRIVTTSDATNPDDHGATLVLTPWISYPEENTEFYEELSRKRQLISGTITSYFSTKSKNQILSTSEDEIKQDIMNDLNNQMTLGKIEQLYFTDYLFLD